MTTNQPDKRWLTVAETAERLGRSEPAVRRMIQAGKLPAGRATEAKRAPWMIDAVALERQRAADEELAARRARLAGAVVGRGDEFLANLDASQNSPEVKRAIRARLLEQAWDEMYADEETVKRFAKLDDDEARQIEEARELARRVRDAEDQRDRAQARAQAVKDRALAILDEEDEPAHEERTPA